jgi:phospholipid transport system substrate-binding protein
MIMSPQLSRGLRSPRLYLAIVGIALLFAMRPAQAAADAEAYVQSIIDEGFKLLDAGGSAGHNPKFHTFVLQHVDAEKSALFALGQYRRGANETVLKPYVEAFRDYATANYEMRLEERKAEKLKVTGSRENKPGDVTVEAETAPATGKPVKIAFRLNGKDGAYKVVDVQAAGAWLSVEQRDQFTAYLSKHNGDINALTQHLIEQTKQMRGDPGKGA